MMMLWKVFCCLLIMAGDGQAANDGQETNSSEQLLIELRALVYRLSMDAASVMEDLKTLIAFNGKREICKEEKKEEELPVISSCEGIQPGLTLLQVGGNSFDASCDGDGWIVVLRRLTNRHDFPRRNWHDYKHGFGNLRGSFWLGLQKLYLLTNPKPATLHVELEAWDGEIRFAQYSFFHIESEQHGYRLHIDGYSGNAGDSLDYHNGMKFTTTDRDNDEDPDGNCAESKTRGGWWYQRCFHASLTSKYMEGGGDVNDWEGMIWYNWKGLRYSYKRAVMKIRLN